MTRYAFLLAFACSAIFGVHPARSQDSNQRIHELEADVDDLEDAKMRRDSDEMQRQSEQRQRENDETAKQRQRESDSQWESWMHEI